MLRFSGSFARIVNKCSRQSRTAWMQLLRNGYYFQNANAIVMQMKFFHRNTDNKMDFSDSAIRKRCTPKNFFCMQSNLEHSSLCKSQSNRRIYQPVTHFSLIYIHNVHVFYVLSGGNGELFRLLSTWEIYDVVRTFLLMSHSDKLYTELNLHAFDSGDAKLSDRTPIWMTVDSPIHPVPMRLSLWVLFKE